jgi:sn-glycerol 3-phosphate transport system permease protein
MSRTISQLLSHFILIAGMLLMVVPIWIIFASSTHDNITILSDGMKWGLGDQLIKNYDEVLNQKGGFSQEITATKLFLNSFIMALGIATLTVTTSLMSHMQLYTLGLNLLYLFFG